MPIKLHRSEGWGWGGDSSSKGLHPPAWCKSLKVPPLSVPLSLAMRPFYSICRCFRTIPNLPSHPHSTSQREVTPQTPPFVSTGNFRWMSGVFSIRPDIYEVHSFFLPDFPFSFSSASSTKVSFHAWPRPLLFLYFSIPFLNYRTKLGWG